MKSPSDSAPTDNIGRCPFFKGQRLYDMSGVFRGSVDRIFLDFNCGMYIAYIPPEVGQWWCSSREIHRETSFIGRPPAKRFSTPYDYRD